MTLKFSSEIEKRFPELRVLSVRISGVEVKKTSEELEKFKEETFSRVREENDLDQLKDDSIFRKYRDFFWEMDIDPTKTRPASEALMRRVLRGGELPEINTLVDAYNLASLKSKIPLAAFDYRSLEGDLEMKFAREDEKFHGIGMDEPMKLDGGEIVVSDSEKLIAIYPYRDSEETKITAETEEVLLMVCGAPGVEHELDDARKTAANYVRRFCGGVAEDE